MTSISLGPGARYTCVAGQLCSFGKGGFGVEGHGLVDGDRFAVLETCGYTHDLERSPDGGVATARSSGYGDQVSWGTTHLTVFGGQYRLCWCSHAVKCSIGEQFVTDVGELLVVGPKRLRSLPGYDPAILGLPEVPHAFGCLLRWLWH